MTMQASIDGSAELAEGEKIRAFAEAAARELFSERRSHREKGKGVAYRQLTELDMRVIFARVIRAYLGS